MQRIAIVCVLLGACAEVPVLGSEFAEPVSEVATDGRFVVVTGVPTFTRERAWELLGRLDGAYAFVDTADGWTTPQEFAHARIVVRVLDASKLSATAVARGTDSFAVGSLFVHSKRADHVFAHELSHLLDARHLVKESRSRLPPFIAEGRAIRNGREYELSLGLEPSERALAFVLATISGNRARTILVDEFHLSEGRMRYVLQMEVLGWFFTEWMRTRLGVAEPTRTLTRIIERIGGGVDFETAFAEELDRPFSDVRDDFIAHIRNTEGDFAKRVAGTVLARPSTPKFDEWED